MSRFPHRLEGWCENCGDSVDSRDIKVMLHQEVDKDGYSRVRFHCPFCNSVQVSSLIDVSGGYCRRVVSV